MTTTTQDPTTVVGSDPVHRVEADLLQEFSESVGPDAIQVVFLRARSQLLREVPPDALPEFFHRLARERLLTAKAKNATDHD